MHSLWVVWTLSIESIVYNSIKGLKQKGSFILFVVIKFDWGGGRKKQLAAVGFEPTPPKRLVPKTSALDRSATLPVDITRWYRKIIYIRSIMKTVSL